jgi:hypothetical protein
VLSVLCPHVIPVELELFACDGSPVCPEVLKFKVLDAPVVVFPAENIKLPALFENVLTFL